MIFWSFAGQQRELRREPPGQRLGNDWKLIRANLHALIGDSTKVGLVGTPS